MQPNRISHEQALKLCYEQFTSHAERARHGLMFGILSNVGTGKAYDPLEIICWERGNSLAVNSSRKHGVILTDWRDSDLADLVTELVTIKHEFNGFIGPEPCVSRAAEIYSKKANLSLLRAMEQKIFICTHVIAPAKTLGSFRFAGPADLDTLTQWFVEFYAEALPNVPKETLEETRLAVEKRIRNQTMGLWVNERGDAVSMGGYSGITDESLRVVAVFTPKTLRGRGYASQLVATMTTQALQSKKFTTLYTDKTNPTSNKIYEALGYKAICDSAHIRFVR